jgi:hypothetical protein
MKTNYTVKEIEKIKNNAFKKGIKFAAEIADQYNGSTTHPYRLGDCILGKLNVGKMKPRKNKLRIKKV